MANITYEVVVLAANRGAAAPAVPCADDSDRGASQTDEDVQVVQNNAQKTEQGGGASAVSLLDAVAALDRASVAVISTNGGGRTRLKWTG